MKKEIFDFDFGMDFADDLQEVLADQSIKVTECIEWLITKRKIYVSN